MCPQGAVFLQCSLESVVSSEKLEQFHIFPFPGIICYDRRSGRGFFLKYGFGRTAVQMACTLLALCLGIGLLRQERMRTVVSIIGSQTALFTENGEENAYWSHLRAERLRETEDVFEIQNHSWNLHEYGERRGCLRRSGEDEAHYAKLLHEDTEQTQQLIEEIGLPAPECYTYPFGACSEESERILREMGFLCTLGCEERINTVTRDPESLYQLGRFNRAAFESTDDFLRRALGE